MRKNLLEDEQSGLTFLEIQIDKAEFADLAISLSVLKMQLARKGWLNLIPLR